jgi:hypothetical protein
MFRITFKGGMEDVMLTNEQGATLMDAMRNDRKGMVELEGAMFDMGSIKGIIPSGNDFGEQENKATDDEMDDLLKKVNTFTQKKIGKKLISPYEQYLLSIKVRGFDVEGNQVVRDILEEHRLSRINTAMEWREYGRWWQNVKDNPDELAAHFEMVKRHRPKNFGNKERTNDVKSLKDLL